MPGFFQKFKPTSSPKSVTNSPEPIANKKQLQTKKIPHKSKKDEATNFNDKFLGHEVNSSNSLSNDEIRAIKFLSKDRETIKLYVKNELLITIDNKYKASDFHDLYLEIIWDALNDSSYKKENEEDCLMTPSDSLKFNQNKIKQLKSNNIKTFDNISKEEIPAIITKVRDQFKVEEFIKLSLKLAISGYIKIFFDVIRDDLLLQINFNGNNTTLTQIEAPGLYIEEEKKLPFAILSGDKCDNDC